MSMRALCLSVLGCLVAAQMAAAVEIKPGTKGFDITGKEIGKLTLQYPVLETDKPVAPGDAKVDGDKITVPYPNGAQLTITKAADSAYDFHFTSVPDDVKKYRINMKLPFSLVGKKWTIGDTSDTFAEKYGGKPMLYQGSEKRFLIENASGSEGFAITLPFGFQQLQDNREWKTNEFGWFTTADLPRAGEKEAKLEIKIADKAGGNL